MKRILTILTALIFLALVFGPLASLANAQDRGDEKQDMGTRYQPPPPKKGGDRDLFYVATEEKITAGSMGKEDGKDNTFFFTLEKKDGLILHYSFFRKQNSEDVSNFHRDVAESREFRKNGHPPQGSQNPPPPGPAFADLGMSLKFFKLREFNDTNEEVSSYDLARAQYTQPKVTELKEDGKTLTGLDIRMGTTDGRFTLKVHIYSGYVNREDGIVGPYEVKYDIIIKDYPFQATDSYLAVDQSLAMPDASLEPFYRELKDDKKAFTERGLGYEEDSASLFFSWATNVTVDGEEHNVSVEYSGRLEGDGKSVETMSFIYPAGASIYHDPKLGAADLLELAEDSAERLLELMLSATTGIGVGIIAVVAVGLRHKAEKFDWED